MGKNKIDLDKATLIGEGKWFKNSAYQVYELNGKYYSVIVYDNQNRWVMDETIEEIKFEDIESYIKK